MVSGGAQEHDFTCGFGQDFSRVINLSLAFINAMFMAFMFLIILLFVNYSWGFIYCQPDGIKHIILKANADADTLVRSSPQSIQPRRLRI